MPTRVKVCGITRFEDAQVAVELGAAALGFNFYPPSPRYLAPAAARGIIRRLPPFVTAVGVFADETDAAHINAVADEAGVAIVQLHGPKFPAEDTLGRYPVIRAVNIPRAPSFSGRLVRGLLSQMLKGFYWLRTRASLEETVAALIERNRKDTILLDTADPVLRGGTGRTFDWKVARRIAQYGPIILAGGLTPENVARAIREVRPYAVDVASGVESAPGVKDHAKLRAFFAELERADREL